MASRPRLTIIGTGFVGTSLGLALQKVRATGSNFDIIGHDKDPQASGLAKKRGAIDKAEWNLIASVEGADLIFVAVPVDQMQEIFAIIAPHLKGGAIVTDTGGSKARVMEWAATGLPKAVNFIGGDPMLGRDGSPASEAAAEVFDKTLYCLTPSMSADADAIRILADFVTGMGAQPYFLDPVEHDGVAGAAAHLPFLMAWALMRTLANSPSWTELQKLAGPNVLMMTYLAGASPAHWEGLTLTNPVALSHWIDSATRELQALRGAIADGDPEEIHAALEKAAQDHVRLAARGREEENPLQDVGRDRIRQMFFGGFRGKKKE